MPPTSYKPQNLARNVCFSLALSLVALLTGCPTDDEASLSRPAGSLAVGGYYEVHFGDACGSSGGKMPSLCRSEGLVTLDSIVSTNTQVLRIVPAKEAGGGAQDTHLVYLGVAPGKAKVRAYGRFRDGSYRSDDVEITVKSVTSLKIKQECNDDSSGVISALPEEVVLFNAYPMAGKEELQGCIPQLLDSVPGLTQSCTGWWTRAIWKAPQTAIQVSLKARMLSKPVATLRTLSLSDISDVRITDVNQPPYSLSKPDSFAMYVRMSTGTLPLCKMPSATLRTLTPEVCTSPQGETQWTRATTGYVFVKGLREGRCQLQASLDGQKWFGTRSLALFFSTPRPDISMDFAGFGNPCKIEGATTCSYGLSSQAVCRDKRWSSLKTCAAEETCDFLVNGEKGCLADASCAACRGLRAQ